MATQYGTIRLQTQNNGTVDVPVWDPADVEYPIVRVQTPSGVGAINIEDPSNADHPYLRVQTQNYGVLAVSGEPISIIDDFEDGDKTEYTGGHPEDFTVQTSVVYEGSYAFYSDQGPSDTSTYTRSMPGDGLDAYPVAGDTITFRMNPYGGNNPRPRFMFGVQGVASTYYDDDWYAVGVSEGSGEFGIYKNQNGSSSTIASTSITFSNYASQWDLVTTNWGSGGTIEATLESEDGSSSTTVSGTDTSYTDGGIAWLAAYNSDEYYDLAQIQ